MRAWQRGGHLCLPQLSSAVASDSIAAHTTHTSHPPQPAYTLPRPFLIPAALTTASHPHNATHHTASTAPLRHDVRRDQRRHIYLFLLRPSLLAHLRLSPVLRPPAPFLRPPSYPPPHPRPRLPSHPSFPPPVLPPLRPPLPPPRAPLRPPFPPPPPPPPRTVHLPAHLLPPHHLHRHHRAATRPASSSPSPASHAPSASASPAAATSPTTSTRARDWGRCMGEGVRCITRWTRRVSC